MSTRPTSVEPVNESLRTTGLAVSTAPISRDGPHTTKDTGRNARALGQHGKRKRREWRQVRGRTMMEQPAASAGATLRVIIAAGKFHGVIAAHTPIG